jgi:cytochrome-b5 reductase
MSSMIATSADANVLNFIPLPVIRPYTPLDGESVGFSELLIKKYPDGKLTPHLHSLKPGDKISVKGPISKFPYQANSKKHIGLIAGGSGITPMLQVADAILSNAEDKTEVSFVFANIAEEDILLRKELDARATKHKNFKVHYVLEKAPKDWKGSIGYVTKDVIQKHIHAPSDDSLVMVCGPPAMMKAISGSKAPDYTQGELDGVLKTMGYTKEQVFKF